MGGRVVCRGQFRRGVSEDLWAFRDSIWVREGRVGGWIEERVLAPGWTIEGGICWVDEDGESSSSERVAV